MNKFFMITEVIWLYPNS